MKKLFTPILYILIAQLLLIGCGQKNTKPDDIMDFQNPELDLETRVNDLLQRLTIEEKADFLSGKDMWHFEGIERLGVPSIQVTDCGHGVTVMFDEEGNMVPKATCFPTGTCQAATWNKDVIEKMGAALGRETRSSGSSILLAPMVNIIRTPLNGRNFETFSEDPYLSGILATSYIQGVQSENVGCVIKHYTANNQQKDQNHLNVIVDKRTLQELYLPNFKIPIEQADPWGLMTAYNDLNGEQTSANKYILEDVLKGDWNYQGFVVSDWGDIKTEESIFTELDIEMPGPGKYVTQENVLKAIQDKKLAEDKLDDKVKRILRALIRTKRLDYNKPEFAYEFNSERHQNIAREVAEEGIVLLKNENHILPLNTKNIKKLAVIGPNAAQARLGGGGSASVTPFYSVSPLEGIKNLVGSDTEIVYEEGSGLSGNLQVISKNYLSYEKDGKIYPGIKAEYFSNDSLKGNPVLVDANDQVDFSWGWASPHAGVSSYHYSVRWKGKLKAPVSGEYKIGISAAQCGFTMYINGKEAVSNLHMEDANTFEAKYAAHTLHVPMNLKQGEELDIQIEFAKRHIRNYIRLEWEVPGVDPVALAKNAAKDADAVVFFAGLSNFYEGGGNDRTDITLPGDQDKLIQEIVKINPNTIVVLQNGSAVAMPWVNEVKGIVEAYYPGQEGGNAIANILFGKVNPSGKLPESFPIKISDTPAYGNYPGVDRVVEYKEGIFVGYKYYDTKNVETLFPFGHGLSYTSFAYSNLKLEQEGDKIIASLDLKNTGEVEGAEVVQLYVRDVESSEPRPYKELRNFEKLNLKPGESKHIEFTLSDEDLAYYSSKQDKWIVEKGEFEVLIGSSSKDIRLRNTFNK